MFLRMVGDGWTVLGYFLKVVVLVTVCRVLLTVFFGYIDNGLMILYAAVGQFEGLFENGWYCITGFGFLV